MVTDPRLTDKQKSNIKVNGGGSNSVYIEDSYFAELEIAKQESAGSEPVRVVTSGDTAIDATKVKSTAIVESDATAALGNVTLTELTSDNTVTLRGSIDKVTADSAVELVIDEDAAVNTLVVKSEADEMVITGGGAISTLKTGNTVFAASFLQNVEVENIVPLIILSASTVTERAGEEIDITVSVDGNPGMAGYDVALGFDNTILTPVSITQGGALPGGTFISNLDSGDDMDTFTEVTAIWYITSDIAADGTLFTAKFEIIPAASGSTEITLSDIILTNRDLDLLECTSSGTNVNLGDPSPAPLPSVPTIEFENVGFAIKTGEGNDNNKQGLRYSVLIPKEARGLTIASDSYVLQEYGILAKLSETTAELLYIETDHESEIGKSVSYVKDGTDVARHETETGIVYAGSIIDIPVSAIEYTDEYTFRPYCVLLDRDGGIHTIYGDEQSSSVYETAKKAIVDNPDNEFIAGIIDLVENDGIDAPNIEAIWLR
jgi:hypothetical protein